MNESQTPILHIRGNIDEKAQAARVRGDGKRLFFPVCGIYLALCLGFYLCLDLCEWYPWLRNGYFTLGEFFREIASRFVGTCPFWLILGFLVLYALILLVIRPIQAANYVRRLVPDGIPITYDFYEDHLELTADTSESNQTLRMAYADVQRKIRVTRTNIILSTGRKNTMTLYKSVMTPQEAETVLELLKARCPQRKLG